MKTRWIWLLATINLLLLTISGVAAQGVTPQAAISSAFVYQGYLTDNDRPASGSYDFRFTLHSDPSTAASVGPPIAKDNVVVSSGLFEVVLDFGAVFNGTALFLQIDVRPGSSASGYTSLTPRQPLMAAPYALYSRSSGALHGRAVSPDTPAGGQVLKWDGTQWAPAADNVGAGGGGGDITSIIAGDGLLGGSESGDATLSANTTYLQRRVSGNCAVDSSIRAINTDGTVTCEPDTDTTYDRGAGLLLDTNHIFSVNFGGNGLENSVARSDHHHYGAAWSGAAIRGLSVTTSAISPGNVALYGQQATGSESTVGWPAAVWGSTASGIGVYGSTRTGYAIRGFATDSSGYAGYFTGRVHVAGTFTSTDKDFKIDHPLDPANKYLYHSSVESADRKNLYDGVVVLDAQGAAAVQLPDWFAALNQEFRYQLTCIGGFAPVYIAQEIQDNRFTIAGGKPGMKVSWQVTGIRHDAYARAHPMQVEEDKPPQERGKYLAPAEHGQPHASNRDGALESGSGAQGGTP